MEPEPTPGVVAVHHQIADDLRTQIARGELLPGDALPTIKQLCERWHCQDKVVGKALDVLSSEGLITRGRGGPARVRVPQSRTPIVLSEAWAQEQKDVVLLPKSERMKRGAIELTAGIAIEDTVSTHHYDEVPASADLASEFDVEREVLLVRRSYEMTDPASGHLLSWSRSYIPRHLIAANPALLDESNEPWAGGHQHQLYTVGIELGSFRRTVLAVQPTPAERSRWGIDTGVPMLAVRSRSIDTAGRVVELSEARYPADRTEITLVEDLQPWPKGQPSYDASKDI